VNHSSRKPATAVLLAAFAAIAAYVALTARAARSTDGPSLEQLEIAIANPDAGSDTWMLYAQRLLQEKRFAHAAAAFQRVLETDPYSREANLGAASALALTRDSEALHTFLSHMLVVEPRLLLDFLGRPEAAPFMSEERFKLLQARSHAQSLD
jgi:tetratricopeptide (TPR) repeat protein